MNTDDACMRGTATLNPACAAEQSRKECWGTKHTKSGVLARFRGGRVTPFFQHSLDVCKLQTMHALQPSLLPMRSVLNTFT